MADWLHESWGKFKGWQRTQPEADRLTRPHQLGGARSLWEHLQREGVPRSEEHQTQLRGSVAVLLAAMDSDEARHGAAIFAAWLKANGERLSKPILRAVAESAQTTDHVSVSLTR